MMLMLVTLVSQTTAIVFLLKVMMWTVQKKTLSGVQNKKNVLQIAKKTAMEEVAVLPQLLLTLLQQHLLVLLKTPQPLLFQAQALKNQVQPLKN